MVKKAWTYRTSNYLPPLLQKRSSCKNGVIMAAPFWGPSLPIWYLILRPHLGTKRAVFFFGVCGSNVSQCLRMEPMELSAQGEDEAFSICGTQRMPIMFCDPPFSIWGIPSPKGCEESTLLAHSPKNGQLPFIVCNHK